MADGLWLVVLTALSAWTRWRNAAFPDYVVWDEHHFAKYGSMYIRGTFYEDIHPPLGKLLIGLCEYLAGFDGNFGFNYGDKYPANVPYADMRRLVAVFGLLIVPTAFLTARKLGFSSLAAVFTASLVLLDNLHLVLTRYMVLDGILLFFISGAFYFHVSFQFTSYRVFSLEWWLTLAGTGVFLGLASSVKWIGFFMVAFVGLYTVYDLYEMLGDLTMPKIVYVRHWIARIICLILVPVAIYMASFGFHFWLLDSGDADYLMSSLFTTTRTGYEYLHESPLHLAYGSTAVIRSATYIGGRLHSHNQTYPSGSMAQIVTCYQHRDANNHWVILPVEHIHGVIPAEENPVVRPVRHGDVIRLYHKLTDANLQSLPYRAPLTNWHYEANCGGSKEEFDFWSQWRVEVVDDVRGLDYDGRIKTLTTRFRLKSVALDCHLRTQKRELQWAVRQEEVFCARGEDDGGLGSMWYIEWQKHKHMKAAPPGTYRPHFLSDFIQLNVVNMEMSSSMTLNDEVGVCEICSRPSQWFFLQTPHRISGWEDNRARVYMIGNPLGWWLSSVAVLLFVLVTFILFLRRKRAYKDFKKGNWDAFLHTTTMILGVWSIHYLPFFLVSRFTLLHHYLPALYFSFFIFGYLLDQGLTYIPRYRYAVVSALLGVVVYGFVLFWDATYGMQGPMINYRRLMWRKLWNIADINPIVS